jgi:FixJ family two-component response regulator
LADETKSHPSVAALSWPEVGQARRYAFFVMVKQHVIAVIDNDSTMRKSLERLLSSYGHRTELYSSAEEFLGAASISEAACLLVDIHLGDISGIELGRHLTAAGFKFPIIFMTGSSDQVIRRQAIDFGCVAFFQKPFGASELIDAIRQCIAPLSSSDSADDTDHLLTLLRRYRAERKAFDDAVAIRGIDTDSIWDTLAKTTWANTQNEIIRSEPRATTATGALLALEHVLQSEDLFADRAESAELQMLWLLVKGARDFVASTERGRQ